MAHPRMVDAFLRELLGAEFGDAVEVHGRGYILPFPARPVVEVAPGHGNGLRVQIGAPVAVDVTAGPALYEALNDVNARLPYGRVFAQDHHVLIQDTVLGESLDGPQLDNAVRFVSWVVETHGPDLAVAGGGRPALDDPDGAAAADPAEGAAPGAGPANLELPLTDPADLHAADHTANATAGDVGRVAGNAAGSL
jgi:hypothetical protein